MQDILDKKILLKDSTGLDKFLFVITIFSLPVLVQFTTDSQNITGLEQSLFVILSAILFVFNDSIIGYQTISKIRNTLNKLSEGTIKTFVLKEIGDNKSVDYVEFIEKTTKKIEKFNKVVYKFKKKSYQLYIVFALLGFFALFLSLISRDSYVIQLLIEKLKNHQSLLEILVFTKHYVINFSIITQFTLIPIWIISAIQAETQKSKLLNYLDGQNILKSVQDYISAKNSVNIEESLSSCQIDNE